MVLHLYLWCIYSAIARWKIPVRIQLSNPRVVFVSMSFYFVRHIFELYLQKMAVGLDFHIPRPSACTHARPRTLYFHREFHVIPEWWPHGHHFAFSLESQIV